jgi:hypothetical protein
MYHNIHMLDRRDNLYIHVYISVTHESMHHTQNTGINQLQPDNNHSRCFNVFHKSSKFMSRIFGTRSQNFTYHTLSLKNKNSNIGSAVSVLPGCNTVPHQRRTSTSLYRWKT